jgi:diguanylate cyclase (GGDEF)-like protein/PAS domain S-box-containing protein
MTRLEKLAYSMIHDCVDAIIAKTVTGAIVSWNAAAEEIFGYSEREMLGHSIMLLVPQDKADEEVEILERLNRGERIHDFATIRLHRNGSRIPVSLAISPIRDDVGNVIGAATIVRAAHETTLTESQLQSLAYQDPLTGMSNRNQLTDRLAQAMRRDQRSRRYGGVLFVDLDNFKVVNDTAGHLVGDKVLVACSRRMKSVLRECDTVARWGGDEFVVMVEDLDQDLGRSLDIVRKISLKLLDVLCKPYEVEGMTFGCPASIGVCLFRGVAQPIEIVIQRADQAMYCAKLAGKNAIHIDENPPEDFIHIASEKSATA